jgi:hypothetical protein
MRAAGRRDGLLIVPACDCSSWGPAAWALPRCVTGSGVLGPEALDAAPFLDLLAGEYESPWHLTELPVSSLGATSARTYAGG